ncbi:MAG: class I SAM-dependent methyltransferase [Leptospiraceae bacterium]|nr:class I SAM-dependent methyltransferase [Leptospiraceae bacterium]
MLMYSELASKWYPLLDPLKDHEEEAKLYLEVILDKSNIQKTLLELGSGAGNNAYYLKKKFQCTLTDLSTEMLALSRNKNPECEHLEGDMRTIRLDKTFDIVFAHDALAYMTSEDDLRAVAKSAFVHTKPGGIALFAPDFVKETFQEKTLLINEEDDNRALRCIEWSWDPNPADNTYYTEYSFLLREGEKMIAHHDRHIEGLFSRAMWLDILEGVGYKAEVVGINQDEIGDVFLCRKDKINNALVY